jgi:hypothetical protein
VLSLSLRFGKDDRIGTKGCRPVQDLALQTAEAEPTIADP